MQETPTPVQEQILSALRLAGHLTIGNDYHVRDDGLIGISMTITDVFVELADLATKGYLEKTFSDNQLRYRLVE